MNNNLPNLLGSQYDPTDLNNDPLSQAIQNPEFLESIKQSSAIITQKHFDDLLQTTAPVIPDRAEELARELKSQTQELQRLNKENVRINQQLETANITMEQQLLEIESHKRDKKELVKQTEHLQEIIDNTKKHGIINFVLVVLSTVAAEIIVLIIVHIFTGQ